MARIGGLAAFGGTLAAAAFALLAPGVSRCEDAPTPESVQRQILEAQADLMKAQDSDARAKALDKMMKATQSSQALMDQTRNDPEAAPEKPKGKFQDLTGPAPGASAEKRDPASFSGDVPEPRESGRPALGGNSPGRGRASGRGGQSLQKATLGAPGPGSVPVQDGPAPGHVYYGRPPGRGGPVSERSTGGSTEGLPPPVAIGAGSHVLDRSKITRGADDKKPGGNGEDEDKKEGPNTIEDKYTVECQRGYHNLDGIPPDAGLFQCLDSAKYCPSWNVYEPDRYVGCLKSHGYFGAKHLDDVLYRCINSPRGLKGAGFRNQPRTRNPGWRNLDFSATGSGLYGDTPGRRMIPCLAQYRYLQGRFDHDCVDSCSGRDSFKQYHGLRTSSRACADIPTCGGTRFGYCLGNQYVCVSDPGGGCHLARGGYSCSPSPGQGCAGPHPVCFENGTGAFTCSNGSWKCSSKP